MMDELDERSEENKAGHSKQILKIKSCKRFKIILDLDLNIPV